MMMQRVKTYRIYVPLTNLIHNGYQSGMRDVLCTIRIEFGSAVRPLSIQRLIRHLVIFAEHRRIGGAMVDLERRLEQVHFGRASAGLVSLDKLNVVAAATTAQRVYVDLWSGWARERESQ